VSRIARVTLLILAVIAGVLIGLTGGFVQAHRLIWNVGSHNLAIPWGVVLVLFVLMIVVRSAAKVSRLRAGGWLVLAGWIVTTIYLATETRSGAIAVSSGTRQLVYVLVGVVVGSAVATLPPRGRTLAAPSENPTLIAPDRSRG
jgi:hypothetical protein